MRNLRATIRRIIALTRQLSQIRATPAEDGRRVALEDLHRFALEYEATLAGVLKTALAYSLLRGDKTEKRITDDMPNL